MIFGLEADVEEIVSDEDSSFTVYAFRSRRAEGSKPKPQTITSMMVSMFNVENGSVTHANS